MPVSDTEIRETLGALTTEQLLRRRTSGALTEAAEAIADELLSKRGVGPEYRAEAEAGNQRKATITRGPKASDPETRTIFASEPAPRAPWLLIKIAILTVLAPLALLLTGHLLSSAIPGCEHTGGELASQRYSNCIVAGIDVSAIVTFCIPYGYFGTFLALGYVFMPSMCLAAVWSTLRVLRSER